MKCESASAAETAGPTSTRVELGRIARPHGLDGGLLVVLHGDDPANLIRATELTLVGTPGVITFGVRRSSVAGAQRDGRARVRVWLDGLTRREQAEAWSGAGVAVPETALAPLPEGEYYWRDLIGLRCRLPDGTVLGVVEEIWPTGANDVLVVREGDRTVLVPALDEVLVRVDAPRGELWIEPPAGLLDADGEA